MANYFLTEELYAEIKKMLGWFRQQVGRRNADPMVLDHEEHPTPDVYIARTGAQGIPASVLNFTATGTSTGSDLQEGPLGHAPCVIYRGDVFRPIPRLLSMSFTQEVYNPFEIDIPAWSFIRVVRDKYGVWWAEAAEAAVPSIPCLTKYRYFCVSGILKEYTEDCYGELTFVRNVGCCGCSDVTTGTGTESSCLPCSLPASLCVDLTDIVGDLRCTPPSMITVSYVGTTAGSATWTGTVINSNDTDRRRWRATFVVTCGLFYALTIDRDEGTPTVCFLTGYIPNSEDGVPTTTFCSLPQTIRVKPIYGGTITGYVNAVVSSGVCAGDYTGTGTSGGSCPCLYKYVGGVWVIQSGDPVTCLPPGLIPTPTEGEIRSTNYDGSTCTGGGSGSSPACASIADTDGSYSTQNATGNFAVTPSTGSMTSNGGKTWTSGNTGGGKFYLACIDDKWWMTYDGLDYAVEATLFYGSLSFGFDFDDPTVGSCRVIVVMNPA